MKALELIVFPKWGECSTGNECPAKKWQCVPCFDQMGGYGKRLTDAELAAEYHAQQMEAVKAFDRAYPYGESAELDAENARIEIVERFATLPHYDEEPS